MIIVIGKSGQLAKELKLTKDQKDVIFLGRHDINLQSYEDTENILKTFSPTAIINASAYTNVDQAEVEKDEAYALNFHAVKNLSHLCKKHRIKFIHISTDYVFDGTKGMPYEFNDQTNPINIYGESKAQGENAIIKTMDGNFSIIRTSWLYSCFGDNFFKKILNLIHKEETLKIINDQISSPTYAKGLAEFIWKLSDLENMETIYHWSDKGEASWYDFAKEILLLANQNRTNPLRCKIIPISSQEFPSLAKRPQHTKLADNAGNDKCWKKNLEHCFNHMRGD